MSDRNEIISRINEARVLNALNNHCRTMAQIEMMVPLCRTAITRVLERLIKRGDVQKVRANKQGGLQHYHFVVDSILGEFNE